MITTGSNNTAIIIEDGQEVYPCPCGETHRGDYALYDYVHHTCPHGDVLWLILGLGVLCADCGGTVAMGVEGDGIRWISALKGWEC